MIGCKPLILKDLQVYYSFSLITLDFFLAFRLDSDYTLVMATTIARPSDESTDQPGMLVYSGDVSAKVANPLKRGKDGKPVEVSKTVEFSFPLVAIKAVDADSKRFRPTELHDAATVMSNINEVLGGNEVLLGVLVDFARMALAPRKARQIITGLSGDTDEEKQAAKKLRKLQKSFAEVTDVVLHSIKKYAPDATLEDAQESVLSTKKSYKPLKAYFESLQGDTSETYDWSQDFPYLQYMLGNMQAEDDEEEEKDGESSESDDNEENES